MKKTIFLLLLLAGLVTLANLLEHNELRDESVIRINSAEVSDITISSREKKFTISKKIEWKFQEPYTKNKVMVSKVKDFLKRISKIKYKRHIRGHKRKKFGINVHSTSLSVLMNDGKQHIIFLGDKSQVSEDYYLEVDDNIFLVSPYYKIVLFPPKNDFVDRHLFPSKISKLIIDKCSFSNDKKNNKWNSSCGRVDHDMFKSFVARLSTVQYQTSVSRQVTSKLGRNQLDNTRDLGLELNGISFSIKKFDNRLMVERSSEFYIIDSRWFDFLSVNSSDFISTEIFDFSPRDVSSIIINGAKYRSDNGLYYDYKGIINSNALKAVSEMSYLKYEKRLESKSQTSSKISFVDVLAKGRHYKFSIYSEFENDYLTYNNSTYELEKYCCKAVKVLF